MKKIGKVVVLSAGLLTLPYCVPSDLGVTNVVEATSVVKLNSTVYETTANLRLRAGAGTNHRTILTIPRGRTVTATERRGNWYKVSYRYTSNGRSHTAVGWVSGSYLKQQNVAVKPQTGVLSATAVTYETTANLRLRAGAGTNHRTILTIPRGRTVTATERRGNWYKVSYRYTSNGRSHTAVGWVSSTYLRERNQYISTPGTYYFTNKSTNLFDTPSTKGKVINQLPRNVGLYSTRKVINNLGQTLYEVDFNGKKLYVLANDVVTVQHRNFPTERYVANKDTFLYASFGSVYNKLEKIPKGLVISSNFSVGNWYRVTYKNKTGYVFISDFSKYVENTQQQKPPSGVESVQSNEPKEQTSGSPNNLGSVIEERGIVNRTFSVTASSLNVRQKPDQSSPSLGSIPKGTLIVPTHVTSNNWYKIQYNNTNGYVSGAHVVEVRVGTSLDGSRDSYQFIDLRTSSPVTAQQINAYIQSYVNSTQRQSVLLGKGQVFIETGAKYGVNPLFLAALAIHESAFGTSNLALTKYNLFGYGAYDASPFVSAYRFASVEQSIDFVARRLKATYLNPNDGFFYQKGPYLGFGVNTLSGTRIVESSEGVNARYANDIYWGAKIAQHMGRILAYDSNYYRSATINTSVPSLPSIPEGSDLFPSNIIAVANARLDLYSRRGDKKSNVGAILQGSTFELVEKTNNFWVRLKYNNQEYWTDSIKFHEYKRYMTVRNLASVRASTLNVRPTPSTQQSPIATLKLGDYVQLALTNQGEPEVQDNWFRVVLNNGRTGWVSGQYINRELN